MKSDDPRDEPQYASAASPVRRRVWRPRFSLAGMLLATVVVCVMAAGGNYLRLAVESGTSWRAVFVIFTLAAPVLLLSAMSIFSLLMRTANRTANRTARKRRRN